MSLPSPSLILVPNYDVHRKTECEATQTQTEAKVETILSQISYFQLRGMRYTVKWLSDLSPCYPSLDELDTNAIKVYTYDIEDPRALQLLYCAKIYFDNGEYRRCADFLSDINPESVAAALNKSSLAVFIKNYAALLAEKVANSECVMFGEHQSTNYKNTLKFIERELLDCDCLIDSPIFWLMGIVLKDQGKVEKAIHYFNKAVAMNPLNWSAWLDLTALISMNRRNEALYGCSNKCDTTRFKSFQQNEETYHTDASSKFHRDVPFTDALDDSSFESFVKHLGIRNDWASRLGYCLHCMQAKRFRQAIHNYQILLQTTWDCPHIYAQLAKCGFEIRSYDLSLQMFKRLREIDRYRFDYVEDLASIYLLKGNFEDLGELARQCQETNRFASSTYCVVGNYLSAQGNSTQAIDAFLSAIRQNQSELSAWILIGHEYTQILNFEKAIDSYGRATQIDATDARAWFGLGRVYELLGNYSVAIHNYELACYERPDDYRFWEALGDCQKQIGRLEQALESYQKSWLNGRRVHSLSKIFQLYEEKLLKRSTDLNSVAIWAQKLFEAYMGEQTRESSKGSSAMPVYQTVEAHPLYTTVTLPPLAAVRIKKEEKDVQLGWNTNKPDYFNTTTMPTTNSNLEGDHGNNEGTTQMQSWEATSEIIQYLRSAPSEVIDAVICLMKYYRLKGNGLQMRRFALIVIHVGGDYVEDAKELLRLPFEDMMSN